jgi:branched-chain amino acid transport system ATP-binding protein
MGIVKVTGGQVNLDGKEITNTQPHKTLRAGISYVPQGRRVFPGMTVWENLKMGGFVLDDSDLLSQRIDNIYNIFPILNEYKNVKAYALSGGEQQMLSLGRALLLDPLYILVDEPSLGLAPKVSRMIFERIRDLNKEQGIGVLMVEQNAIKGLELADTGYVLDLGKIEFQATCEQLLQDDKVRKLYLGR